MKKYKAKKNPMLFILIIAVMVGSTVPLIVMAFTEADPMATVAGLTISVLMFGITGSCVHMLLTTCYVIDGDQLIIHSGILYNKKLNIESIRKIQETNNPISSPAPSLDRLEIFYNRFDSVLISPKDKQGLIAELIKINPAIKMHEKSIDTKRIPI